MTMLGTMRMSIIRKLTEYKKMSITRKLAKYKKMSGFAKMKKNMSYLRKIGITLERKDRALIDIMLSQSVDK